MWAFLLLQLEFIGRLILAGICGGLIGYERKNRLKEAGIRTHLIVALASALMMIISKYGFDDILKAELIRLDPSRVASSIITGVSFLGAGIIFVRKQSISGLTTAAGIWATSGVGMAIGSGLYIIGIAATIIIIIIQVLLHRNLHWLKIPVAEQIVFELKDSREAVAFLKEKLVENNVEIIHIKTEKIDQDYIDVELYVKFPAAFKPTDMIELFSDSSLIRSIEI